MPISYFNLERDKFIQRVDISFVITLEITIFSEKKPTLYLIFITLSKQ